MKQLAQYQDGRLQIQDVPSPQTPRGGILVRTTHSVISPGTERMKVEQANMNLLQKARARPDQVKKVLHTARTLGWQAAYDKVKNRLETPTPLGYSAAGHVLEVSPEASRFRVGDRVAVAGNASAFHAEVVAIPELLAARIPDGVDNRSAAFATLAAIAMHGVRQSGAAVGERVLILGQGLVGLLATGVLRAAGARVMAVDLDERRLQAAADMGAEQTVQAAQGALTERVRAWTDGYGVDAALVCTAGSNGPVEQAVDAMRDRGVLVIVGMTNAELDWKALYHKEIEVRYSRSYGPGRYDADYETRGRDYPIGYVRWTEQRNLEACLELMRSRALPIDPLISRDLPFSECLVAYDALIRPEGGDIGIVLHYERDPPVEAADRRAVIQHATEGPAAEWLNSPVVGLDVVGAGNFVKTMLLPRLNGMVHFGSVVTQTSLSRPARQTEVWLRERQYRLSRVAAGVG